MSDYKGEHEAPGPYAGYAALYDLTKIYPADVYEGQGYKYYGDNGDRSDAQAFSICMHYKNHPNRAITVYRAVPKNLPRITRITTGDWVTIVKAYAADHGRDNLKNDYRLLSKRVYARDLFTEGNSLCEWGYHPMPFDHENERLRRERRTANKMLTTSKQRIFHYIQAFISPHAKHGALYHGTEIINAARILANNKILPTNPTKFTTGTTEHDAVSLTRSLRFAVAWKGGAGAVFELDEKKIRRDYPGIVQYDYYQDRREAEERIPGTLKPLDRYLLAIYISPETRDYCVEHDAELIENHKDYDELLAHPLLKVVKFPRAYPYYNPRKPHNKILSTAIDPDDFKVTEIKAYPTLKGMIARYGVIRLAWYPDYVLAWDANKYTHADYDEVFGGTLFKYLHVVVSEEDGHYTLEIDENIKPQQIRNKPLFKKIFGNVHVRFMNNDTYKYIKEDN